MRFRRIMVVRRKQARPGWPLRPDERHLSELVRSGVSDVRGFG